MLHSEHRSRDIFFQQNVNHRSRVYFTLIDYSRRLTWSAARAQLWVKFEPLPAHMIESKTNDVNSIGKSMVIHGYISRATATNIYRLAIHIGKYQVCEATIQTVSKR